VIFKNTYNTTLDNLKDRQGNILTNPEDIAEEIYIQQSILNQPAIPTCHHQPAHNQKCICGVRQYPWHNLNGFVLEKRGDIHASISNTFDRITYGWKHGKVNNLMILVFHLFLRIQVDQVEMKSLLKPTIIHI
jgi:hypothetical protein